jgi:hypothetical protein
MRVLDDFAVICRTLRRAAEPAREARDTEIDLIGNEVASTG